MAAFDFQEERTKVRVLVDTPDSTTVAHGFLDVGAETLEIKVVPDPKGVNLKVSAPIVVHGSLSRPDYRVEKGEVLLSLTELATKIAVPQILLLDAFSTTVADNPCVKIVTGRVEQEKAVTIGTVTEPIEQVLKGAGSMVKETGGAVVKGIGGLLKRIGGAATNLLGSSSGETDEEPRSAMEPE